MEWMLALVIQDLVYLFQRNDPHSLGRPAAPPARGNLVKIEVQTIFNGPGIIPWSRRLPRRRSGILGKEHVCSATDAAIPDVIVVLDRTGLGPRCSRV